MVRFVRELLLVVVDAAVAVIFVGACYWLSFVFAAVVDAVRICCFDVVGYC